MCINEIVMLALLYMHEIEMALYIIYIYSVLFLFPAYIIIYSNMMIIAMSIFLLYDACLYVCIRDIRDIYFCFILLCVWNILTQCMVFMYLIDAYCCDTGWMHYVDGGSCWWLCSICKTITAAAWSWCTCKGRGK